MSQQRILIVLSAGAFRGASMQSETLKPVPLDLGQLSTLLPDLNAAAVARVAELEVALAAAPKVEELAAKTAEIASLRAQLELARNPPQPDVLAVLGEAFKTLIPAEYQGQLGAVFATVRVLVQAGEMELAAATIAATPVPPELADAKAQFLTFFAEA